MKPTTSSRPRKGGRVSHAFDIGPPRRAVSAAGSSPAQAELFGGDCFIVINRRGQCWGGSAWVDCWCEAIQFRRPNPAYELCADAAHEAEQLTGTAGMVCYIPAGTPASYVMAPVPDLSQVDLRDFALSPEVC
jgi:hypothetical protein